MARAVPAWLLFFAGIAVATSGGIAFHLANRPAAAVGSAGVPPQPAASAPSAGDAAAADVAAQDVVPEPSREQKRFSRYDRNRDSSISEAEFLANRRKAFDKLDTNGDGKLDFSEYARKTELRFQAADANHDNRLTAGEFATTARPATKRKCDCAQEEASDASH